MSAPCIQITQVGCRVHTALPLREYVKIQKLPTLTNFFAHFLIGFLMTIYCDQIFKADILFLLLYHFDTSIASSLQMNLWC